MVFLVFAIRFQTVQRSALCRSRRELSNAYFVAKVGFDTAENEPCKVCPLSAYRLLQIPQVGFLHADPHPGNMLRSPEGELVILDFGLVTEVTDEQKFGMIDAIVHLIRRDYSLIGDDFKNLGFISPEVDVEPIIPVLSRVFDQALAGGGARSINFNLLAADLAEITYKYPFSIPPYFALIIRAISILEGIALVGNPKFAIIDEAFPYIARRMLTDPTPRLQESHDCSNFKFERIVYKN